MIMLALFCWSVCCLEVLTVLLITFSRLEYCHYCRACAIIAASDAFSHACKGCSFSVKSWSEHRKHKFPFSPAWEENCVSHTLKCLLRIKQHRRGEDGVEMKSLDHQATHCCALLFDESTLYYIRVKKEKGDYFFFLTHSDTHI